MPIQTVNTDVFSKPNSGTSVQKTLKDDVTTYFAKIAIGTDGSGSLVTEKGQSKGTLAVLGPQDFGGSPTYLVVLPAQQVWLGSPAASVELAISSEVGAGDGWLVMAQTVPSVVLTETQPNGINIVGIGDQPVGVVKLAPLHLSGSTEPAPETPPSGSFLTLTIHGTKSPVF